MIMSFICNKDAKDRNCLSEVFNYNRKVIVEVSGVTSLTDEDIQRISLLESSNLTQQECEEYLTNNRDASPLKFAIDTKQFEIADEMIDQGYVFRSSELDALKDERRHPANSNELVPSLVTS
jgi:hypothetical protein